MRQCLAGALAGVSLLALTSLAQAQTFTWTGPSFFSDASSSFGSAFTATNLNINGNARFDDNSLFGNSTWSIILLLNGGGTKTIASGTADPTLFSASAFNNLSFVAASIVGIRFESDPNGFLSNNFSQFANTQFVFSNTATAVPGPMAGTGAASLLGLAGAWFVRRRNQKLAA